MVFSPYSSSPNLNTGFSPPPLAPKFVSLAFIVMFRIKSCAHSVLTNRLAQTPTTVFTKTVNTNSHPAMKTTRLCAGTKINAMSVANGVAEKLASKKL